MATPEKKVANVTQRPVSASNHGRQGSLRRYLTQPDSLVTEQLRKLRSALAYHDSGRLLRALLITSCLPGEGKTTVAINLSAVMAKGDNAPVILIDADLRRRSLTSSMGLKSKPGLADVLAGNAEVQDVLVKTVINNLYILPAGSNPSNPAELIASAKMRNLLGHLKEQYEGSCIIIDSTPLISTSEPNVLTELVDGVLLVIQAEKTRRDIVKRELKSADSQKILGVVLNGADFEASQYYRKYYTYESQQKR